MSLKSVLLANKSNLGYCVILFAEAITVLLEYYNNLNIEINCNSRDRFLQIPEVHLVCSVNCFIT